MIFIRHVKDAPLPAHNIARQKFERFLCVAARHAFPQKYAVVLRNDADKGDFQNVGDLLGVSISPSMIISPRTMLMTSSTLFNL